MSHYDDVRTTDDLGKLWNAYNAYNRPLVLVHSPTATSGTQSVQRPAATKDLD
ncbi:hypothetical protein Vi05172_g11316 [Venturia inaequalis]|nr:hypothetical protein Vi05172_g11316 [Venturia inaequalis]